MINYNATCNSDITPKKDIKEFDSKYEIVGKIKRHIRDFD